MSTDQSRKKRTVSIRIDSQNIDEFEGLAFDFGLQKMYGVREGALYPLMGKSRLEYTRERDNGFPKSLHISSSVTQDIFINGNHQLFSYDHLISVDTNTHYLNGSSVSLTAAYHLKVEGRNNSRVFCNGGVLALLEVPKRVRVL